MKIDTDIPIPVIIERACYPWNEMAVGHSFLFPSRIPENTVRCMVTQYNRRNPSTRFIVRKTPEGMRCWRIS